MLCCSKVLQGRIGDSELQAKATLPQHAPQKFTRTEHVQYDEIQYE
jgi:hypothetical protein